LKRFGPSVDSSLLTLGVIAAVGLVLSVFTVVLPGRAAAGGGAASVTTTDGGPATQGSGGQSGGSQVGGGGTGSTGSGAAQALAGQVAQSSGALACASGHNGGATDTGVSATSIKLAATVVDDGPGSSFLAPVRIGMNAVVNKVNKAGGVCGRQLNLLLQNDSWDAQRGQQYIQNFVEGEKVFALAVVPSSEGLRAADGYIAQQKVPVVGTDGMLIHQYRNPWIWPVASSTITQMHVMAQNASTRGSKQFGIVFDAKYHFGVEGAYAFDQAVKRLTGSDIQGYDPTLKSCNARFCGIQPSQPSYGSQASSFNSACGLSATATGGRCDFVALLMEPDTALTWLAAGRQADPAVGFGLAQPLFTRDFEAQCKDSCNGMWVWTGYNPPIEAFANTPGVAQYASDIRHESSTADINNQFLEGGYDGMNLLVSALNKVGPQLTRGGLKAALDSMSFDSGLSSPMQFKPGNHFANVSAQAFIMEYNGGPLGWRYSQTGFLTDPWPGQDIPPGE
jgi:ABC-type branched-subunit amino acid transport system substrate-binding protein